MTLPATLPNTAPATLDLRSDVTSSPQPHDDGHVRDQEAPRLDTVGEQKHADTLAPRVARRHRQDR
jgi:hypothetical protein